MCSPRDPVEKAPYLETPMKTMCYKKHNENDVL